MSFFSAIQPPNTLYHWSAFCNHLVIQSTSSYQHQSQRSILQRFLWSTVHFFLFFHFFEGNGYQTFRQKRSFGVKDATCNCKLPSVCSACISLVCVLNNRYVSYNLHHFTSPSLSSFQWPMALTWRDMTESIINVSNFCWLILDTQTYRVLQHVFQHSNSRQIGQTSLGHA